MKKLLSIALLIAFAVASTAFADQRFSQSSNKQLTKRYQHKPNSQYKYGNAKRVQKPSPGWQQRDKQGNLINNDRYYGNRNYYGDRNYYYGGRNYPSKRFYGGRYYNDPYYTEQYYGTREVYGPYREYYEEYYNDPYYSGYREYRPRRPRLQGYCEMPGFTLRFYADSNCVIHKDHFHCD